MKIIKITLLMVAVLFGLVTVFPGSRVLLGSDPGYVVYRPLLIFNTVMGFVYVFAAVIAWQHVKKGMILAAVICVINLIVLVAIYYLYSSGGSVAVDSVRAMTLRTTVWFLLLVGFAWLSKKQNPE